MEQILTEVGKALLLMIVIPVITPLLQLIDVNRKRASIKRKIDNIKTMYEMEGMLYSGNHEERKKFYQDSYAQILSEAKEFNSFEKIGNEISTQEKSFDAFDIGDKISAVLIPLALFSMLVPMSDSFLQGIAFSTITIFAAILSFYFTKKIICTKIKSGFLQKIASFLISFFMLIPGIVIVFLFGVTFL